jgi:hypothetical protein
VIPKKGITVQLDNSNIKMYQRIISIYEGHKLDVTKDGKIIIDGKETDQYTFKMDYYWMMGDNRHNSLDSRYGDLLPEDHIVGKACLSGCRGIRMDHFSIRSGGAGCFMPFTDIENPFNQVLILLCFILRKLRMSN